MAHRVPAGLRVLRDGDGAPLAIEVATFPSGHGIVRRMTSLSWSEHAREFWHVDPSWDPAISRVSPVRGMDADAFEIHVFHDHEGISGLERARSQSDRARIHWFLMAVGVTQHPYFHAMAERVEPGLLAGGASVAELSMLLGERPIPLLPRERFLEVLDELATEEELTDPGITAPAAPAAPAAFRAEEEGGGEKKEGAPR